MKVTKFESTECRRRAAALSDIVLATWDPPERGLADPATVAQTAVMVTLAFLGYTPPVLSEMQAHAIKTGVARIERELLTTASPFDESPHSDLTDRDFPERQAGAA